MSFEEVYEELTMDRYNTLCRFWVKNPPMAVLFAHYVGYKPPSGGSVQTEDSKLDEESAGFLQEMFGAFPQKK